MDLLTIVIPVFNQWPYTRACLQSLREKTPGAFYRVVVADNGSTDATAGECAALGAALFGERFEYRRLPENVGFGRGCNAGAEGARSKFLLFLNNDTLLTGNWLAPLVKSFERDPRLGAVSPLLIYPDSGRVQHIGISFDPNMHPVHLYHLFPPSHPAVRRPRRLQAVSGAALLLPTGAFRAVGGFWPEYVNGSEDMDLSCQLRRKGLELACVPESLIEHHTSVTPGRYRHTAGNAAVLNARCGGCFAADLHRFARRDGFSVALAPWLESFLRMDAARERELDARFAGEGSVSVLREVLEREPLWEKGYAMLAGRLKEAGDLRAAYAAASLGASLFPAAAYFQTALDLADSLGLEAEAGKWRARQADVARRMAEAGKLRRQAREALAWCQSSGESGLQALYENWLAQAGE